LPLGLAAIAVSPFVLCFIGLNAATYKLEYRQLANANPNFRLFSNAGSAFAFACFRRFNI
jgi:hypothetical protein